MIIRLEHPFKAFLMISKKEEKRVLKNLQKKGPFIDDCWFSGFWAGWLPARRFGGAAPSAALLWSRCRALLWSRQYYSCTAVSINVMKNSSDLKN